MTRQGASNSLTVRLLRNVHKLETGSDEVVHRHKKLFEGIGEAQRDSQDIEIHLPLKANAIPITQKPRRVPYHLMDPLKKRIKEFVENDIMINGGSSSTVHTNPSHGVHHS